MISGFYMSMVWTTKYSTYPNPIRTFYISRVLRIYPLYFTVVLLTIFLGIFVKIHPFQYSLTHEISLASKIWVYVTQITLVGMESSIFYGLDGYWISPVAWSLGLELTFYLLVPFLIPRPRLLVAVLFASLFARYATYSHMGWQANSPDYSLIWSYRFFPFELALFALGSLSYQLHSIIKDKFSSIYIELLSI